MQTAKQLKAQIIILVIIFTMRVSSPVFAQPKTGQAVSLSLKETSELALKNNLDIQIAKFDAYINRTALPESESVFDTYLNAYATYLNDQQKTASAFLGTKTVTNVYGVGLTKKTPAGTTLGVELSDSRNFSNSSFTSLSPSHEANVKFTLQQPLGNNFFGLIDRGKIKITRFNIANNDFSTLQRIEEYLAQTQTAYWNLSFAYKQTQIAQKMLEKAETLYKIFQDKQALGLVEAAETCAAEANVQTRQVNLQQAQHQLFAANNELLYLLHEEDLSVQISPTDFFGISKLPPVPLVKILQTAIANRRDYQQAKNNLAAYNIDLKIKENSTWPQIDLNASFAQNGLEASQSTAWDNMSQEDNPELYLGLSVQMSLENRAAAAGREKAQQQKTKALIELKKIEHKIAVEINNAYDQLKNKQQSVQLNKTIVDLQEKKLNFEETRFARGRSNSDTLIRYQDDLLNAQLNFSRANFEYKKAIIDLQLQEGSLLKEYWQGEI
ncbi:MAG: TolC family protein [Candidatus Omnitrophota bacterium]